MIKVLLANDLEIVRALMRYVLEKEGGTEVPALASNGQEAGFRCIALPTIYSALSKQGQVVTF
jgi:DNA-binding NarL/FixJ family response regulator